MPNRRLANSARLQRRRGDPIAQSRTRPLGPGQRGCHRLAIAPASVSGNAVIDFTGEPDVSEEIAGVAISPRWVQFAGRVMSLQAALTPHGPLSARRLVDADLDRHPDGN
jgi:hypothetical protein